MGLEKFKISGIYKMFVSVFMTKYFELLKLARTNDDNNWNHVKKIQVKKLRKKEIAYILPLLTKCPQIFH